MSVFLVSKNVQCHFLSHFLIINFVAFDVYNGIRAWLIMCYAVIHLLLDFFKLVNVMCFSCRKPSDVLSFSIGIPASVAAIFTGSGGLDSVAVLGFLGPYLPGMKRVQQHQYVILIWTTLKPGQVCYFVM